MEKEPKPGKQREISYQVGWKEGKIERHDPVKLPGSAGQNELTAGSMFRLHEKLMWRPVPAARTSWLFPLLYLVPILLFMLTFMLVFTISHP